MGALFFLAVVWILRQNPSPASTFILSDKEKNTARGIYTWLLVSPILTIPLFIALLFNLDDADRSLATMIPLIVHLPLLMGLTSKNTFLFRHAQQGILLIALRTGMSTIAISDWINPEYGIWIFLLGNGSLWLCGSVWGWKQISRGECWWMKQKGEKLIPPESAKADSPQMNKDLEDLLKSLNTMDKLAAKTKAIHSFRSRSSETRKRAVEVLSKLGEVEKF